MEVFATFDIMNSKGVKVAEGHKASFCLEDNQCMPGIKPFYACANFGDQGISVNCTDIYRHNIDCQWVDISELNPGMYTFKVSRLSDGKSSTKPTIFFFFIFILYSPCTDIHIVSCFFFFFFIYLVPLVLVLLNFAFYSSFSSHSYEFLRFFQPFVFPPSLLKRPILSYD